MLKKRLWKNNHMGLPTTQQSSTHKKNYEDNVVGISSQPLSRCLLRESALEKKVNSIKLSRSKVLGFESYLLNSFSQYLQLCFGRIRCWVSWCRFRSWDLENVFPHLSQGNRSPEGDEAEVGDVLPAADAVRGRPVTILGRWPWVPWAWEEGNVRGGAG